MRIIEDINFGWLFKDDYKEEYIYPGFNPSDFTPVSIPHTNIEIPYNYFDESIYAFDSCYRREIFIPQEYSGKDVFLCLEGAAHYARVFINGTFVDEHKGGYTGFEVKIDERLFYNQNNLIAIHLDSKERDEIPPFGNVVDYLTYGGIYREVYLKVVNKIHIKDIFIKALNPMEDLKAIEMDIQLSTFSPGLTIDITVSDDKKNIIYTCSDIPLTSDMMRIKRKIQGLKNWDIDDANLYTFSFSLNNNNIPIDEVSEKTGFREALFKKDGFYLNGRKIKLRGLNRHQSYPYAGYAMPASVQADDARILREVLGVNIVRTSHYPQSRHFINECDRIGLPVFTEIPGWQHISKDREWRKTALQNVEEMILQNRNHPSIILWGVRINESGDDDELYMEANRIAHDIDPSRQTGGVRCIAGSNLLEDVYTYNDFIFTGENRPLEKPEKITRSTKAPYLVTEHNGHMFPTKRFDHEEKRLEHALRHLRVMDEMYGNDRISGAIGWCMSDYNTHKDFGSGDRICYHGVTDMFRIPKPAAYAYSSQQDKNPVMEVISSMDMGEHAGSVPGKLYVFTNLDFVRFYKNDSLIGDFYPDIKNFPHLPHAPVLIDDLVGPYLQENENLKKSHAHIVKEVLNYTALTGAPLRIRHKLKMLWVILRTNLRPSDGYRLYSTYIGNWGTKKTSYRFEGYKDGELIKTVIKSAVNKPELKIYADRYSLVEDKTCDAVRMVVQMVCENENPLPYAHEIIKIKCEGPVTLMGDETIPLIGGAAAFYIKTKGESGKGVVRVSTGRFGEKSIDFEVEKK